MALRQSILLLLVLHCTGVLVVGVTSFREREQILGLFGGGVCVVLARSVSIISVLTVLRCGPCLSFYSFKGGARVTFMVKR
jgi:ABC-type microcin C transport system permease subunit YejE